MAPKKSKPPVLKVIFDTNVIFNKSADYLLTLETTKVIEANSGHGDLIIEWCLPEVVKFERQYQMNSRALEFLPHIRELERLIGVNLNITESKLKADVENAISKHVGNFNLKICPLDSSKVNWPQILKSAAFRIAPFEKKEDGKEKGFRDAMILETFAQLVDASPTTPKVCRIALVTADENLQVAAKARTIDRENVRILASLQELTSLINTIVSTVPEEYIKEIQPKAAALFFKFEAPNDPDVLLNRAKVRDSIRDNYGTRLSEVPKGSDSVEEGNIGLSAPAFIRKNVQRVYWSSRLRYELKSFKFETKSPSATTGTGNLAADTGFSSFGRPTPGPVGSTILTGLLSTSNKVAVSEGIAVFDVKWSCTVNHKRALIKPQVDEIVYVETTWK